MNPYITFLNNISDDFLQKKINSISEEEHFKFIKENLDALNAIVPNISKRLLKKMSSKTDFKYKQLIHYGKIVHKSSVETLTTSLNESIQHFLQEEYTNRLKVRLNQYYKTQAEENFKKDWASVTGSFITKYKFNLTAYHLLFVNREIIKRHLKNNNHFTDREKNGEYYYGSAQKGNNKTTSRYLTLLGWLNVDTVKAKDHMEHIKKLSEYLFDCAR